MINRNKSAILRDKLAILILSRLFSNLSLNCFLSTYKTIAHFLVRIPPRLQGVLIIRFNDHIVYIVVRFIIKSGGGGG